MCCFIVYNSVVIRSTGGPASERFNITSPNVLSPSSAVTAFLVGFAANNGGVLFLC